MVIKCLIWDPSSCGEPQAQLKVNYISYVSIVLVSPISEANIYKELELDLPKLWSKKHCGGRAFGMSLSVLMW